MVDILDVTATTARNTSLGFIILFINGINEQINSKKFQW